MRSGAVLFIAALIWLVLGVWGFFSAPALLVFIYYGLVLLPFIVADALVLLLLTDRLSVQRRVAVALALGTRTAVQLVIERTKRKTSFLARSIAVFDIYPDTCIPESGLPNQRGPEGIVFPAKLKRSLLKKYGSLVFEYSVVPVERGQWEFTHTDLLLGSPLGFWRLRVKQDCLSRGRTFPDFKKLAGRAGELRGIPERTGLKKIRKRGQGLDFMSLREYQKGDSVKAIDWRATGRRRKFIVREYQEEQDQQVLILLDSGYRLHRPEEGRSQALPGPGGPLRTQFDSALEASLVLSWAALKYGDSVSIACFGAEKRWLPPRKGMGALSSLMRNLYDLKSAPAPSSLFSALEEALSRLKRRTFIIMISNFREEDGESLSWILKSIGRRHLPLLVSLREAEAESIAARRSAGGDEALESAAAFFYLSARRRLYKTWEHMGLLTLECSSPELSPALINRYLEVKRSGLL
ncbi:MAG: DUF58 domain-containing protein [Treponema sp.]|jgi:uncharacterized protein (DUF58 family)|nr:DUF58 domain-containing protein [Treponema sp.]